MNGKKLTAKNRHTRRQNKTLADHVPSKHEPEEYLMDGYYGTYQTTRTVIAVGLATALVLE